MLLFSETDVLRVACTCNKSDKWKRQYSTENCTNKQHFQEVNFVMEPDQNWGWSLQQYLCHGSHSCYIEEALAQTSSVVYSNSLLTTLKSTTSTCS
ncbi:hypothetical protein C0J52_20795 [Blattella germanica]|nr:hypothetical protein C0J52_20795 [Blattella germanica]